MALLAKHIPEDNRHGLGSERQSKLFSALDDIRIIRARLAESGEVSFDVCQEDGNADAAEALGHGLQGDSFASSGGTGDQAVPVRHVGYDGKVLRSFGNQNCLGHSRLPFVPY